MSIASRKRRRAKRRAFWERVAKHGAFVSPDVWEALKKVASPAPTTALFGYGAVPIEVTPLLRPGSVVPMGPRGRR